jgi:hypothetical protein
MLFSPSVSAGPKDAYNDRCLYVYAKPDAPLYSMCTTKQGRVVSENEGSLYGYLNRDYVYYRAPPSYNGNTYRQGGYVTARYELVNNNNTLVEYECSADSSGACTGGTTKSVMQYVRAK